MKEDIKDCKGFKDIRIFAGSRGGLGHALAQAAFLDEGFLQLPDLAVQQEARYSDQADDHIGGNGRVGVLDSLTEGGVGSSRDAVEVAEPAGIRVLRGPLRETSHPQEIPVVGQ